MKIAIVGTGNMGAAFAGRLATAGHEVRLAARDEARLASVASATGATPAPSLADAARDAEIILLAVPWDAVEALAAELAPIAAGRIVVDATNAATPDWSGPRFAGDRSAAERIASWLPRSTVVKAFNTTFAANVAAGGTRDGVRLDALVAADDPEAKAKVMAIAADIGFDPIDAGPLANARYLEAIAWLNIGLNMANGWPWKSGWKLVGAPVASVDKAAA